MRGPIKTIFPSRQFSTEHLFFIKKLSQTSPYEGREALNKLWNVLVQQQGEATTKEYCTSLKKKINSYQVSGVLFGIPTHIFSPGSNIFNGENIRENNTYSFLCLVRMMDFFVQEVRDEM